MDSTVHHALHDLYTAFASASDSPHPSIHQHHPLDSYKAYEHHAATSFIVGNGKAHLHAHRHGGAISSAFPGPGDGAETGALGPTYEQIIRGRCQKLARFQAGFEAEVIAAAIPKGE